MKKADSQQILRVIKRLNESQTRWYVAREAISLGRGGIKKMNEIIDIVEKMQEEKSYDSDQSDFENNPMPEQPQPLLPLQKLLRGEYRTQMDKLVREGYLPLSTEDIMDLRNLVLGYDFLWKNYFHTDCFYRNRNYCKFSIVKNFSRAKVYKQRGF